MRICASLVALALILTGCIPEPRVAPPPAPAPPPRRAPPPTPSPAPLASDWRDWPLTPGDWRYGRTQFGSIASFGAPGTQPTLTLSCDNDHRVRLGRPLPGTGAMTIRTTSTTRSVAVAPTGDPPSGVAAAFAPTDPLLEAIGFSRGRFVIEQAGLSPLVIPAWAEIERVIEDCRR